MALYNANNTPAENLDLLAHNPYPGRLLIMGYAAADIAIQAYAIGGRSDGSRNRVFELQDNIVSTAVADPEKPVGNPLLTIYDAMRRVDDIHIVSNGDQTDTVVQYRRSFSTFEAAMEAREYEPDAPNYTPRITGFMHTPDDIKGDNFGISVIRKADSREKVIRDLYGESLAPFEHGIGYGVHTYRGEEDGRLLSFNEAPFKVPLEDTAQGMAELLWNKLDRTTMVAVVAKAISATGEMDFHIINAHEQ